MRVASLVVSLVILAEVASIARADDVTAAYDALATTDRRLQLTLAVGGAASTIAGATMCGFSRYDHALQVAGGVTLAFGVADLAAGVAGYLIARKDALAFHAHPTRDDLLRIADSKGVVFAVNLGFDAGFMMAGLVAIGASRATIAHDGRWLGGGVATLTQGVFAAVVDFIGMRSATRAHRRALAAISH